MRISISRTQLVLLGLAAMVATPIRAEPPRVGQKAPDFSLRSLRGGDVELSGTLAKSPVVLIVLRGYPGYQCPFCNRQAQDLLSNAQRFKDLGASVLMVYPGGAQDLEAHAKEFAAGKTFPNGFDLLLDPNYRFTQLYGLRWNAANETAYPSTFLINRKGVITFAKISREHGGRTTAAEILEALRKTPR